MTARTQGRNVQDVQTRSAAVTAGTGSLNAEARTIKVIWTTGAAVKRYSWDDGYYMEELAVDRKSIRLDRFEAMSLLDGHEQSMDARLGTVVPGSVKIEGGKAMATLRLSRNAKAEAILQDLEDGHPINISVGYKIHRYEKTEGGADTLPTIRAIDWEPMELSVVAVPADPGAVSRKEQDMPEDNTPPEPQQRQQYQRPANLIAERRRVKDIRELARFSNIPEDEMDRAIDSGMPVETFRSQVFNKLVERQNQSPTFPHVETTGMGTASMSRTDAMASALYSRVNPRHEVPNEAREFVGLPIAEIARRCIEARGDHTMGLSPAGLITRALHTTSDFPEILANVANRELQAAYSAAPSALKQVARQSSATDFRAKTLVKLSAGPGLEKVGEHGEFKRGTFSEAAESYRLETFGKIFGATRQILLNDQLGAFTDVAAKLGRAAEAFEASFLATLLESNPTLNEKVGVGNVARPLFHADRKNLASTGGILSESTLHAARLAMRKQVGLAGELVAVTPAYLIVPSELETTAEKVLAAISAAKTEDANIFANRLTLIVEPRLTDAKAWYVAASPAEIEGLEYSYLASEPGPQIESRAGFDVDGVEVKVRLDYGAAFLEHRGWYKNPGQ